MFVIEDQLACYNIKSNYSILCNNVIQYAILGYLNGKGLHVVLYGSKERNLFYRKELQIELPTKKFSYSENKQNGIILFKRDWKAKRLLFNDSIYGKMAELPKIDDISDCYVMVLYFIKTNTNFIVIE